MPRFARNDINNRVIEKIANKIKSAKNFKRFFVAFKRFWKIDVQSGSCRIKSKVESINNK